MDVELRFHIQARVDDLVRSGIDRAEAERLARIEFGPIESVKEECRDTTWVRWLDQLTADLRYAVRCWRRAPAFAAAAILTLALGIAANTAIFSLLDALLLRPLPVAEPYRLIKIGSLANNGKMFVAPGPLLDDLRREPLLNGVCGVQTPLSTVALHDTAHDTANDAPFPVGALALSGDCYRTLGIRPAIGRLFTLADDASNAAHVVVLSYSFWQDKFAENPGVLGQIIRIEGAPFTIIGVTEPRFHGLLLGFPPGISFPISQLAADGRPGASPFYWADILARLKPDATPQQVRATLAGQWRRLLDAALPVARFQGAQRDELLRMPPVVISGANGLDYSLRDRFRQPLAGLLVISVLVLLVACANVANLLLARGLDRRPEIAIRLALGAKRGRIVNQLITESILLIVGGFGLAIFLSSVSERLLLSAISASYIGLSIDTGFNIRTLLFAAGSASVALLFGIIPAWQTSDTDSGPALKTASRSVKGGRTRTQRILISGQVALTMTLVMGASLFVETLQDLRRVPLGFATQEILDAQLMAIPGRALAKPAARAYFSGLVDRLRNLPGVEDASLSSFFPLLSLPYKEGIRRSDAPDRVVLQAPAEFVSDGFLRTMRIPLLQGRDFRPGDEKESQKTVIVSNALARRLFPEGNALGRHIRFGSESETHDLEIAGIAADARLEDPRGKDFSFLYLNLWQLPDRGNWGNLQLRYSGNATQTIAALQTELRRDGRQYINQVRSLTDQHERSLLQERLLAGLGASFGCLALTLAAIGLFGLLSFFVTTRTSEIGLRIALGAERWHICRMVISEACILVATGILIGLPFCYIGGRMLSRLVYGIATAPIVPLVVSSMVLIVVAAAATLIPTYRASSVDPVVALRYE
jgi:predicted permease